MDANILCSTEVFNSTGQNLTFRACCARIRTVCSVHKVAHNGINNQYCKDSLRSPFNKNMHNYYYYYSLWHFETLSTRNQPNLSEWATHSHTLGVLRCQWQCAIQNSLLNEHAAAMDLCLCLCKYTMSGWLAGLTILRLLLFFFLHWQPHTNNTHITVIDTCSPNRKKNRKIERNEHNGYAIHFDSSFYFAQLPQFAFSPALTAAVLTLYCSHFCLVYLHRNVINTWFML